MVLRASRLVRHRRGSVAVMTALLLMPVLGAVALCVDASIWLLEQHRLQIAADAAAHAAALQLTATAFQTGSPTVFATLVANEARAATGGASLVGRMATPVISVTSGYTAVTVTLTSTADTFFVHAVRPGPVTLRATATAGLAGPASCVLTLSPTGQSLTVGGTYGSGSISTSGCPVFSNSSSSSAIYVSTTPNSITATSIGTVGNTRNDKACTGTACFSVAPVTNVTTAQKDPVLAKNYALPSASSCTYTNYTATAYKATPYALTPGVYCGTTTIGGNGMTQIFAPGTYVFTGDVVINNANITSAAGVTFVMTGATATAKAGTFTWQNNSGAVMTAPVAGAYAGLLFWQACPTGATSGSNGNGLVNFNGGSALTASGTVYAPCGTVQVDNNAQLKAVSGSNFSVISANLNVWQGALLAPAAGAGGTGGSLVALTR